GRTLAYLGDAVWSLLVREYWVKKGEGDGNRLQQKTIAYVSAKAQAFFYQKLHEEGFFSEEEEEIFRRGRNAHSGVVPHNTDVGTYRISTGFEALIGALYLVQNEERIRQIWDKVRTE
ncbi:MAG: Mini-ribonuclease 3, partial [Solobacterium sp.]|nr:Mini-ribonuclease 3 [Solobacterium sp.]